MSVNIASQPLPSSLDAASVSIIAPAKAWRLVDLRAIWRSRDLLWYLTLRDVQVRYKQTVLGALWAIIQPLAMMTVATLLLGRVFQAAEGVTAPYPIYVFAGMLPWMCFSACVTAGSNSLVANQQMLQKVAFPRLVLPLASAGAPLLDLCISLAVLAGMMVWFQVGITASILLLPVLIVSILLAALSVTIPLAALNVTYRDCRYVVPFLVQVWFFVTPVIYPVAVVPQAYRWMLQLNPIGGPIEAFRAATLGTPMDWTAWAMSTAVSLVLLLAGLMYFGRTEQKFADLV